MSHVSIGIKKDGALTREQKLKLKNEAISVLEDAKIKEKEYQLLVKSGKCEIIKSYDSHLKIMKISYLMNNSKKRE